MFFVSKSEPRSTKCGLEVFCSIDEEHSIIDLMFLSEFPQEPFCQHGRSGRIQSYMGYVARFWINSTVQPIPMSVTLNHRFVKRDVIQFLVNCRL